MKVTRTGVIMGGSSTKFSRHGACLPVKGLLSGPLLRAAETACSRSDQDARVSSLPHDRTRRAGRP
jgi:hypothetical protein